jgi:hypothetical protein
MLASTAPRGQNWSGRPSPPPLSHWERGDRGVAERMDRMVSVVEAFETVGLSQMLARHGRYTPFPSGFLLAGLAER